MQSQRHKNHTQEHNFATQEITFDDRGTVTESDDILFDTASVGAASLFKKIPFIESLAQELKSLTAGDELLFERVEVSVPDCLLGIYDYKFTKSGDNILWTITDKTEIYNAEKTAQQKEQEKHLF